MASSFNKVILIGRLGGDPQERRTTGGVPVSTFSLATDAMRPAGHSRPAGETATRAAEWHRIVAYGRAAEQCNQYLRKGRLICVDGHLKTRQWERPTGEKRTTTEVVVHRVSFLDSPDPGTRTKTGSGGRSDP